MGTKNSVVKVSPAGLVDGQQAGLINIPDFDPAHFVAPTTNASWTNYVGTTTASFSAFANAGYVVIKMGSTLYRLPAFSAT